MLVLDHDRAGGYWGAVYVFTAIKGLQVVIDGPVGCENLPVTSVLHYTDALPPHELPIVVTGLSEEELGRHGTEGAMRRAHATLDPDLPSVVVTGSIAEMIGGGVTPEGTGIQRFLPRTIDEDQWQSADRAMAWLWSEFGAEEGRVRQGKPRAAGAKPRVNIIGPIYGMFNMPSDLAEIRRLVEGIGAEVNMVFPLGSHVEEVAHWGLQTPTSVSIANLAALLCEALGPALSAGAHRAAQHDEVFAPLGELLGLDPEPFIEREKHTTIKPIWDLWRSVTQDFLAPRPLRLSPTRPMRAGVRHFLEEEMGLPCSSQLRAVLARRLTTRAFARPSAPKTPLVIFGSYNERMYLAEAGARAMYIPASFPGAIVRRHTGTPFMGYGGATYIVQEVCNALFDALFQHAAARRGSGQGRPHPCALHRELAWDDAARMRFDSIVEAGRCFFVFPPPNDCATWLNSKRDGPATSA